MRKKAKRKKSEAAWAVVFLIFATSAVWFCYTDQPFPADKPPKEGVGVHPRFLKNTEQFLGGMVVCLK
jgi:hypothetical protein